MLECWNVGKQGQCLLVERKKFQHFLKIMLEPVGKNKDFKVLSLGTVRGFFITMCGLVLFPCTVDDCNAAFVALKGQLLRCFQRVDMVNCIYRFLQFCRS